MRDARVPATMTARLASCLLLSLVTAGCLSSGDPVADATVPATAPPPGQALLEGAGCNAVNAFATTDEQVFRPFVPENWTFTTGTPGRAILRILVVSCADHATVLLSTPMVPDAASAAHHDNPDVVVEAFVTDEAEAARWTQAGAKATPATITGGLAAPWDQLLVETGEGVALDLDLLPVGVPGTPYDFEAVYATGAADAIAWLWGHEASLSVTRTRFQATLGPGSVLEGALLQTNFAQRWSAFDPLYRPGLPEARDAAGAETPVA